MDIQSQKKYKNYYIGTTALIVGCREGIKNKILKLLIENNCNINLTDSIGNSAFMYACDKNNGEIMEMLLDRKVDINQTNTNEENALIRICKNKKENLNCVKLLVKRSINIHHEDNMGNTALFYACENSHSATINLLLSYQININHINKKEENLLIYLLKNNCKINILNILIKNAFNIHYIDPNGCTILHHAIKYNLDVVKYIIESGCDVNIKNLFENTFLTIDNNLSAKDYCDTINFAIKHGYNINNKNLRSKTAIFKLIEKEHDKEVIKHLTNMIKKNIINLHIKVKNGILLDKIKVKYTENQKLIKLIKNKMKVQETLISKCKTGVKYYLENVSKKIFREHTRNCDINNILDKIITERFKSL